MTLQPCSPANAATDKGCTVGEEQEETVSEQKERVSLRDSELWRGAGRAAGAHMQGASIQVNCQGAQGLTLQVPAAEARIRQVMCTQGRGQDRLSCVSTRHLCVYPLATCAQGLRHKHHLSPGEAPPSTPDWACRSLLPPSNHRAVRFRSTHWKDPDRLPGGEPGTGRSCLERWLHSAPHPQGWAGRSPHPNTDLYLEALRCTGRPKPPHFQPHGTSTSG